MGAIVSLADVKTALRETSATFDTELNQIITRVEARLQGAIDRNLASHTVTGEKHWGNGTHSLQLHDFPIISVASVAIESEAAITHADANVLRIEKESGILTLVARLWTYPGDWKVENVSVTYDAGYAAPSATIPDVWELLLDLSTMLFKDMDARRRGVESQTYADGSITYALDSAISERFVNERWNKIVQKFSRVSLAPARRRAREYPSAVFGRYT